MELQGQQLSNADLRKLLDQAMIRFNNWKVQMEVNPNPRMAHSLKNILSIINSISGVTERNTEYTYKTLSKHMAILIKKVAELNIAITESLEGDDIIDAQEEKVIVSTLMQVVHSATDLLRIVQEGFGLRNQYALDLNTNLIRDDDSISPSPNASRD